MPPIQRSRAGTRASSVAGDLRSRPGVGIGLACLCCGARRASPRPGDRPSCPSMRVPARSTSPRPGDSGTRPADRPVIHRGRRGQPSHWCPVGTDIPHEIRRRHGAARVPGRGSLPRRDRTDDGRVQPGVAADRRGPCPGTPNVLIVVLDDTGFGQLGCYGSPIATPNIDALAADGLRYSNMHTTALCSPSRSCIVTGRNHHSNGMAAITELASGYPGYNGIMPFENGMLSEMLLGPRLQHLHGRQVAPDAEQPGDRRRARTTAGPWPAASSASTGSSAVTPASGIRSSCTTTTRWSRRRRRRRATTSARTWSTGPCSSSPTPSRSTPTSPSTCTSASGPRTLPTTWPRSGRTGTRASSTTAGTPTGRRSSPPSRSWASSRPAPSSPGTTPTSRTGTRCPSRSRRLFSRMMEVFAGFLSHTDHHLGRLLDFLRARGDLDNTIVMVVSDNGASAEGGPTGTTNEAQFFNNAPGVPRGQPRAHRRDRWPDDLQPLPVGLDVGRQHAVPAVEAGDLPGWRLRPVHRLLAAGHRGQGRGPHPVRAHHRHGADRARPARHRAAGHDPGRDPVAPAGGQLRARASTTPPRRATTTRSTSRCSGSRAIYHDGWRAVCPWPGPVVRRGRHGLRAAHLRRHALRARRHRAGSCTTSTRTSRRTGTSRRTTARGSSRSSAPGTWRPAGTASCPSTAAASQRMVAEKPQAAAPRDSYTFIPGTQSMPFFAGPRVLNRPHSITAQRRDPRGRRRGRPALPGLGRRRLLASS